MSSSPPASASLTGHRSFALFWLSRFASTAAFQMQAVATGWLIYDLTGSAFDLGLVGLVMFVPVVGLALVVGHVADRYDRRLVIRACQIAETAAVVEMAVGSASGWLTTGAIFAIVFVIGVARAFEQPSLHALVPGLVPGPLFPHATAASAAASQSAIIVGPAIGGILYAAAPAVVFGACGGLFLLSALFTTLIRLDRPVPPRRLTTLASLFAGVVYVGRDRVLLGLVSLDLFAVLLGGATALLPIYARDILAAGPVGLGALRAAPALGALATTILLARRSLQRHVGRIMLTAVATFGIATMVFAVSTSFVLSLAALAVLGIADSISVVIRQSLVQLATPEDMRGRVSAVNAIFIGTSNTLGEFESGVTASWFGTVPAVLLGGIGTLAVALLWTRLFPELARVDRLRPMTAPSGATQAGTAPVTVKPS